jgi:hypothetical protein
MSVRCRTYALNLTLAASWPPTRSGEPFNCKHPDYRAVDAERAVRLPPLRGSVRVRQIGNRNGYRCPKQSWAVP